MRKPKQKYNVYLVGDGNGCYSDTKDFIGTTYAVSEKQAINNVRFNTRNDNYPCGGPTSWIVGDYLDQGFIHYYYSAELEESNGTNYR